MLTKNWLKVTLLTLAIVMLAGFVSADTISVPINKSNYTKINTTLGPITIEARSDRVYLALADTQPELWSQAAHMLEADEVIKFGAPSSDVWALATAQNQNVVVTEEVDLIERAPDGSVGIKSYTQDQTSPPFDLYFTQATQAPTTLTAPTAIDDYVVTVASVTGLVVGDYCGIFSGVSGENRFYFGEILSIGVPTALDIELDTPLDYAYQAGDIFLPTTRDLNVDGSVTRQDFAIQAGGPGGEFAIDITRVMIEITTATQPAFSEFGDLPKLTKGLVLRRVDGEVRNLWTAKSNAELAILSYDFKPINDLNPGPGETGILVRYTIAGPSKHGVAVRLEAGDRLESLVGDNLAGLPSFRMLVGGHVVQ